MSNKQTSTSLLLHFVHTSVYFGAIDVQTYLLGQFVTGGGEYMSLVTLSVLDFC